MSDEDSIADIMLLSTEDIGLYHKHDVTRCCLCVVLSDEDTTNDNRCPLLDIE